MIYHVRAVSGSTDLDSTWTQNPWRDADELQLASHIRQRPPHFPPTRVKLLYDDQALHVYFRVEDRYIRAVAEKYHDPVCRDSCAEFFFTPGEDLTQGYFNVEINCTGVLLMYHQTGMSQNTTEIDIADCARLNIWSSLPPGRIDPELPEPTTWEIRYRLPYDMLAKYAPLKLPKPGTTWRGNFYKCADDTSHPHWISWAPIDHPNPNFHLPQFFGAIRFD